MTTENDFHAALDSNPDDWQTRLVFADWLQEQGDPRAEGYRALGALRRLPLVGTGEGREGQAVYLCELPGRRYSGGPFLPEDWYALVGPWNWRPGRRAADDAAARAFTKLPARSRSCPRGGAPSCSPRSELVPAG